MEGQEGQRRISPGSQKVSPGVLNKHPLINGIHILELLFLQEKGLQSIFIYKENFFLYGRQSVWAACGAQAAEAEAGGAGLSRGATPPTEPLWTVGKQLGARA